MKLLIAAGAAFGLAGMMFAASTFSGSSPNVQAGQETPVCVTYTPTRTVTRTPTPGTPTATASPTNTSTPTTTPTTILISNEHRSDELYGSIADGGISGGSSEGGVSSLGNETPRAECPTPTRTGTATVANSSTPVNTSVPATNTPTGGGGGVVSPPDTGTGDGLAGSGMPMWSFALLAAIAAIGGGAVLVGARKRS